MSEHLVFNQILRQSARCLISDLVVGQVEFDDRGVEGESRRDEFEEFIIDEVACEVQD